MTHRPVLSLWHRGCPEAHLPLRFASTAVQQPQVVLSLLRLSFIFNLLQPSAVMYSKSFYLFLLRFPYLPS